MTAKQLRASVSIRVLRRSVFVAALLVVLALVVVAWLLAHQHERVFREIAQQETLHQVQTLALELDGYFARLTRLPDIIAAVDRELLDAPDHHERLMEILRDLLENEPGVLNAYAAFEPGVFPDEDYLILGWRRDADGTPQIARQNLPGAPHFDPSRPAYDYHRDPNWYIVGRDSDTPVWGPPYFDEGATDQLIASAVRAIYGPNGALVGVAGCDVPISWLTEMISMLTLEPTGSAFLIQSDGLLVTYPGVDPLSGQRLSDLSDAEEMAELARAAALATPHVVSTQGAIHGEPVWAAYAPIPSLGWGIIGLVPIEASMGPVMRYKIFVLLVALGAGVTVSGIGWLLLHRMSSYLRVLDLREASRRSRGLEQLTYELHQEIAERKQAENRLLENEAHLNSILRAAPIAIGLVSDRVFRWVSERMTDITGYEETELLGQRSRMLYESEVEFERVGEKLYQAVWREGIGEAESRWVRKDGAVIDVYLRLNAIDQERPEAGVIFTALDITDRVKAEDAVRESERYYRSIISGIHEDILIIDREYRIIDVNESCIQTLGAQRDDIIGRHCFELSHGFNAPCSQFGQECALREVFDSGQTRKCLHQHHIRDGKVQWTDILLSPMKNAAGDVTHVIEATRNVDELVEAREALKEQMHFTQAVIDALPVGVAIHTMDAGGVLYMNRAFETIYGWPRELMQDYHAFFENVYPDPDFRAITRRRIEEDMASGDADRMRWDEIPIAHNTGEKRYVSARNVALPERNIMISTVVDVTDRVLAAEERRQFDAQVQHAQKLESLGVLAGGIAHDFNNLLMAVLGNADLALMELSPVSPSRSYIEEIERASRRAADLCRQMLAYSGKGHFVIQPLNLSEVVREMAHMLEVSISKKAVLKYRFADNLPLIEADATQIRQVIMNLIVNASEAIGEKSGIVTLTTDTMECDRSYLTETYLDERLPEGRYAFIEVSDTGCGMDEDVRSRLFEPFFSTKFTGRGLGMAAVLGIVRGHLGAIKVYSEPRRGTTFKILFPAFRDVRPDTMKETVASSEWLGDGMILLVDDEESVRSIGARMLERLGFNVLTAFDGREAIQLYKRHKEEIACVLLDLTMPHMDGEETFRELRRIKKEVRVVLSSGYSEHEVTQRFMGKGLSGFIQKPYRALELKALLRDVLEKGMNS